MKSTLKEIRITDTEVPASWGHFPVKGTYFKTWKDANRYFKELDRSAEQHLRLKGLGGYYKTFFKITWEDGETYEGRFDAGDEGCNLSKHCALFRQYLTRAGNKYATAFAETHAFK